MKIVINAGHTKFGNGTGASKYLNELIETRKVAYSLMKLLSETQHEVIPAVFDKSSDNLKEAVEASDFADLFVSIHFNAGGGQGSEVYTWKGNKPANAVGILNNLSKLGFKNRGIKVGSHLYVIRHTTCASMLVEVCFVDNESDVDLYKRIGCDAVAKAIFDAIK